VNELVRWKYSKVHTLRRYKSLIRSLRREYNWLRYATQLVVKRSPLRRKNWLNCSKLPSLKHERANKNVLSTLIKTDPYKSPDLNSCRVPKGPGFETSNLLIF
jgi:hypothetical protein